ncbi:amidohydrolase family protein [Streptomyces syringium]|uniref:amidohydrolase family protein n=1 Tax=Streptomyces syringium TaxID=76729 RepID=UPI003AAEA9D9
MSPPVEPPVDPLAGPRFAVRGRVVTMNGRHDVIDDGVVYINEGVIDKVAPAGAGPPEGHEHTTVTPSGGSIYPGLIELHNHLPYNVLPLWQVPENYPNRTEWGGARNPDYGRLVTGPMRVLGEDVALMPAVVRYVEAKALVNGTTTSQGIALFSNAGARRMYRGVVRNVEATDDPALPEAATRIADVEAANAGKFLARLNQGRRLLLHLAEGRDTDARDHFLALKLSDGDRDDHWAITENLIGIHCTGLLAEDFPVLARHGGSMVWSPLSNLLLYGRTAEIAAARRAGVRLALGSDWTVSGSKGLLGELKAARLASAAAGGVFTDRDLVDMATRNPAVMLRWETALGSLRAGARADLIVVAGAGGDAYSTLIDARDSDLSLVVIAGHARYGTRALMDDLTPGGQLETGVRGLPAGRAVNLRQASADPVVGALTLAEAARLLTQALADLPGTADRARRAPPEAREAGPRWRLALDEIEPTGAELRPRLPLLRAGRSVPSGPVIGGADADLAEGPAALPSLRLDGLTATKDATYRRTLGGEMNLPPGFAAALEELLT